MLFRQRFLDGIRAGSVTLAFRRWRRPSVRSGGTLLTPVGQLEIGSVSRVCEPEISLDEARSAGYPSREALMADLNRRSSGDIYRIELLALRPDPRISLRESLPDEAEVARVLGQLNRLDRAASDGAWTLRVLDLIAQQPGVAARNLCALVDMGKDLFKLNVRKLKNMGLTESLGTGYRLSPRGDAIRNVLSSAERSD
jgi:hypothetical protein